MKTRTKVAGFRETFVCRRSKSDPQRIIKLRAELARRPELDRWAERFRTLGNHLRLRILFLLGTEKELCVCDLSDVLGESVSSISHQLRRLREEGFVQTRREAQTIFYRLDEEIAAWFGIFIDQKKEILL